MLGCVQAFAHAQVNWGALWVSQGEDQSSHLSGHSFGLEGGAKCCLCITVVCSWGLCVCHCASLCL